MIVTSRYGSIIWGRYDYYMKIWLHNIRDIFIKANPRKISAKQKLIQAYLRHIASRRLRKSWFFSNKFNLFLKCKFSKINQSLVTWELMNISAKEPLCLIYIYIYMNVQLKKETYRGSKIKGIKHLKDFKAHVTP